jgi:putative transposase
MPRLSAAVIDLSDSEREVLETLLNRHNTPQQIALRAKIILRAAKGETHGDIAQALGVTKDTSRLWRAAADRSQNSCGDGLFKYPSV